MTTGDFLGAIGVLVGIIGFAAAIYQIVLAKREIIRGVSIAEATKEAVGQREHLGAVIELMTAIPQLQRLERDLAVSVRDGNQEAVANQLQDWRKLVAEMRGLIAEQGFDTTSLESRLQESSSASAQAISLLDSSDLKTATKWVLTQISSTSEEAGFLMGKLRAHPGGERGGEDG